MDKLHVTLSYCNTNIKHTHTLTLNWSREMDSKRHSRHLALCALLSPFSILWCYNKVELLWKQTAPIQSSYRDFSFTALMRRDWKQVFLFLSEPQKFLQGNTELNFTVVWLACTCRNKTKKLKSKQEVKLKAKPLKLKQEGSNSFISIKEWSSATASIWTSKIK